MMSARQARAVRQRKAVVLLTWRLARERLAQAACTSADEWRALWDAVATRHPLVAAYLGRPAA